MVIPIPTNPKIVRRKLIVNWRLTWPSERTEFLFNVRQEGEGAFVEINEMDEEDERRSLKQQKQEKFMGPARLAAARKLGIMINVSNCNRWIFIFLLLRS